MTEQGENSVKINQLGFLSAKSALYIMKKKFSYWLLLSVIGFAMPFFIFEWISASYGFDAANQIKAIIVHRVGPLAVETILNPVAQFLGIYLGLGVCVLVGWLATYFMMIWSSEKLISGEMLPRLSTLAISGLTLALKRGLGFIFLLLLLLLILKSFLIVFLVLACLALMSPVILSRKTKGVFSTFKEILTLSYADNASISRWHVLLQIVSYGAFLLALILGIDAAVSTLPVLDQYLSLKREIFLATGTTPALPYIFFATTLIKGMCFGLLFCLFAIFTTGYYLQIQNLDRPILNGN